MRFASWLMAGLSRFGITPDADEAVGQQAGKGDMLAHPDDNVVSIVDTGTTFRLSAPFR